MSRFTWAFGFLTVPGAVMRAFLEHLMLKICRVPVEDTAYLHPSELFGHVEHKPVRTFGRGFAVCFVPGFFLFLFGAATAGTAALQLFGLGLHFRSVVTGGVSVMFLACVVLLYLGLSFLCHAFPSYEDALYLWESRETAKPAARILLFPFTACMRAGAFLSRFGVWQILYAALTAILFIKF